LFCIEKYACSENFLRGEQFFSLGISLRMKKQSTELPLPINIIIFSFFLLL